VKPPRRRSPIVGLLMAIGLGVVLAIPVAIPVLLGGGHFKEGPYCSEWGIGKESPIDGHGAGLTYLAGDWGGFPPRQDCRVYDVERPADPAPGVVTTRDALEAYPHRLVAEGSYPPKPGDYTWVLVALLVPPALWALFSAITVGRRRWLQRSVSS